MFGMKIFRATVVALGILIAQFSDARAVTVYVDTTIIDGISYDVSLTTGTYLENETLLQAQPWWGSSVLAGTFALSSTEFDAIGGITLLFAHGLSGTDVITQSNINGSNLTQVVETTLSLDPGVNAYAYMIAELTPIPEIPVPASLPLALGGIFCLFAIRRARHSS